jgi:hypothetical protein
MTLWYFTRAPAPAMGLALAVESAGMIMVMVMVNAYRYPGSETIVTWWVFIATGLFDLPVLWEHTPRMLYAYPLFFIIMSAGVLIVTAAGARASDVAARRSPAAPAAGSRPAGDGDDGRHQRQNGPPLPGRGPDAQPSWPPCFRRIRPVAACG